jgi:hypothetical protein
MSCISNTEQVCKIISEHVWKQINTNSWEFVTFTVSLLIVSSMSHILLSWVASDSCHGADSQPSENTGWVSNRWWLSQELSCLTNCWWGRESVQRDVGSYQSCSLKNKSYAISNVQRTASLGRSSAVGYLHKHNKIFSPQNTSSRTLHIHKKTSVSNVTSERWRQGREKRLAVCHRRAWRVGG